MNNTIYLDHNATTSMHPDVQNKITSLFALAPINPSSVHSNGRMGKRLLEIARRSLASLVGIKKKFNDYQVIFTSGGTESNSLILSNFQDGEIFISATEHPSIFVHSKVANNVTIIPVNENGILDTDDLINKLKKSNSKKKLVSVMLANNETGILQPIRKISDIAHKYGAVMHSDCVQAVGKIDVNIENFGVDFISISSHKFGGPMGVGALIGKASVKLCPLILGGGQEYNIRSGTENLYSIVGFGEASRIVEDSLDVRFEHMNKLRIKLEKLLSSSNSNIEIVGTKSPRLPNTSLIINPDKNSETQLIALDLKSVAVSGGSACSSGKVSLSHVLVAMGYSENKIKSALRISIGSTTTEEEIDNFVKIYNTINE